MQQSELVSGSLSGLYHDVVRATDGGIIWDGGWRKNMIVGDFRRLLCAFSRGAPVASLGIQGLQIGGGLAAWDAPPGPPPTTAGVTALVDPAPVIIPRASLQFDFLVGGVVSATPTNRLQIKASIGPGVPPWPDASHPTSTLREFGLIGELQGAPVLLNYVIHSAIPKDPASTLDRTIWLVF